MSKRSMQSVFLYSLLSLVPFTIGLYVLFKNKMIIGGKLAPAYVYELKFPADIIVAAAFFHFSALILVAMTDWQYKKIVCEWIFLAATILFVTAVFI